MLLYFPVNNMTADRQYILHINRLYNIAGTQFTAFKMYIKYCEPNIRSPASGTLALSSPPTKFLSAQNHKNDRVFIKKKKHFSSREIY